MLKFRIDRRINRDLSGYADAKKIPKKEKHAQQNRPKKYLAKFKHLRAKSMRRERSGKNLLSSSSMERAAEFADRHNIEKAYGSYEELARDANVEVVYVRTIHLQHAPLCKLALSHGKHVLCEKPMTMNLKKTKEMFQLAKAKGLFVMEVRIHDLRNHYSATKETEKCFEDSLFQAFRYWSASEK